MSFVEYWQRVIWPQMKEKYVELLAQRPVKQDVATGDHYGEMFLNRCRIRRKSGTLLAIWHGLDRRTTPCCNSTSVCRQWRRSPSTCSSIQRQTSRTMLRWLHQLPQPPRRSGRNGLHAVGRRRARRARKLLLCTPKPKNRLHAAAASVVRALPWMA